MTSLQISNRDEGLAHLSDVRNDSTPTNWVLFGYQEGSKNNLVYLGKGSGGYKELIGNFKADKVLYALLRVTDQYDQSITVKFVYIIWVGDAVKGAQKALITTHKGEITSFIGQHHIALYGSNLGEISEDVIMSKVTDASGSSNRVLSSDNTRKAGGSVGSGAANRVTGGAGTGELAFVNENEGKEAINRVRNNTDGHNYALFSYDGNTNNVALVASGAGGISDLVSHLQEDGISYGLIRVTDKIDDSETVKFVLISWVGETIPAVRKAKITTHKSAVDTFIGQHHNDIYASKKNELTEEAVISKVRDTSGTQSRVRQTEATVNKRTTATTSGPAPTNFNTPQTSSSAPAQKTATTASAGGAYRGASSGQVTTGKEKGGVGVPSASTSGLTFADEDNIRAAFADVRSGKDDTNWVLIGYGKDQNTIELKGKGSGGINELKGHLDPSNVAYGLYRTTNKIDETIATKFVFIIFIGEKVPGVKKARVATHKGAVTSFIGQFHCDVTATNEKELSEEIVANIVGAAAGTKINVIAH